MDSHTRKRHLSDGMVLVSMVTDGNTPSLIFSAPRCRREAAPSWEITSAVPRTTAKRPWPRAEFEPKKNHAGRVTGSRAKTARLRRGHPGRFYRVYRM